MKTPFLSTITLAWLLTACADRGTTVPGPPDRRSRPVPESLLTRLIERAADDAGVRQDEVMVVVAESVRWRDGSLGCPQPGRIYPQALVPGYRVVLSMAGREIAYHASTSGDFRPCPNPAPPADVPADR